MYCIPTKFHCCQTPNGRVNLGGGGGDFLPPLLVQYRDSPDPVQSRVKIQAGSPVKPNRIKFVDCTTSIKLNRFFAKLNW